MVLTPTEIFVFKAKGYTKEDIMKRSLRILGLSNVVKGKRKVTKKEAIAIDEINSQISAWF